MERVLRAVSDLTYAQATEYRPVWYEDAHASLFEDPTEIGAQFDDATEDVYRIFRTANFKRESERQGHAESLRSIRCGREDATAFELWVKGALQLLFGHTLEAIELKPNGANATRRDIVARNNGTGTGSFFARLLNDYGARLQVFEVKNYAESTAGDFQQVRGYLNRPHYGDIGFLVTHSSTLEVSEANWNQIREVYNGGQERKLVLVLPSELLIRWLKYSSCQPEGKFDKEMHAWLDECLLKHLPD
ncbi:hypothetical protein GQ37_005780 [Janthinobacterium sp. BJB1]|nr:hypothetical protein GQ37_005780 [Janthinobacterium sp. BJB1]